MSSPPTLSISPILSANTTALLLAAMQSALSSYQSQHANCPQEPELLKLLDTTISDITSCQTAYQVSFDARPAYKTDTNFLTSVALEPCRCATKEGEELQEHSHQDD